MATVSLRAGAGAFLAASLLVAAPGEGSWAGPAAPQGPSTYSLLRRAEVMARKPDSSGKGVRVWTLHQDKHSRTNLVEMEGTFSQHIHPDANHTLLVLEGEVLVTVGAEPVWIRTGDYLSIQAGSPHGYSTKGKALLMSFDAPAYDSSKTIYLDAGQNQK